MNMPARRPSLPLPASAIALGAAFVLGVLHLQTAGWLLFGLGALAWVRLDAKNLLQSDLYGLAPALALLAYPALAGSQASASITFGLALHALAVFLQISTSTVDKVVNKDLLTAENACNDGRFYNLPNPQAEI